METVISYLPVGPKSRKEEPRQKSASAFAVLSAGDRLVTALAEYQAAVMARVESERRS
jgi:hypothetical protein